MVRILQRGSGLFAWKWRNETVMGVVSTEPKDR